MIINNNKRLSIYKKTDLEFVKPWLKLPSPLAIYNPDTDRLGNFR